MQEQTLATLRSSAFNKIRFCIFPKHYDYNPGEPRSYPYEGTSCDSSVLTKENFQEYNGCVPGNHFDYRRFNPEHFQHFERRVRNLCDAGIQADIIVMHPYDRWGFSGMDAECDDLYWNYVVSRLSAFRNVWWSLANEYDLMTKKTLADWERYAAILCRKDFYNRLRGIHNCRPFYDHSRPWITHCSIQRQDVYKSAELIEEAACRGGYAGHGETFLDPQDILWWSHGGVLHGESPVRLKFLRRILEETPGLGLAPMSAAWDEVAAQVEETIPGTAGYFLYYYGFNRPSFREYCFDNDHEYRAEAIDTWNITIEDAGVFRGKFRVELPGREFMAVRIRRI